MAEETGGRWVTMRGTHVFIKDAQGGTADLNHSPHNLRQAPPSHAPGHENPPIVGPHTRTGLKRTTEHVGAGGGKRPAWMSAANARQVAKSERLARSHKMPGKLVPKGTPLPKMSPVPADPYGHKAMDNTIRTHLYG